MKFEQRLALVCLLFVLSGVPAVVVGYNYGALYGVGVLAFATWVGMVSSILVFSKRLEESRDQVKSLQKRLTETRTDLRRSHLTLTQEFREHCQQTVPPARSPSLREHRIEGTRLLIKIPVRKNHRLETDSDPPTAWDRLNSEESETTG